MAEDPKQILLLQAPPIKAKNLGLNTKKTPEAVKRFVELVEDGKDFVQISKILGVSRPTLYNWIENDSDLFYAVNEAKLNADAIIEKALFDRAKGYKHKDVKIMQFQGEIITEEFERVYPPDVEAIKFYLKNRQPQKWKDKTEVEAMVGTININIDADDSGL